MNIRNPKYNAVGTVDVEIEHPLYGWIPFTAQPQDTEALGRDIYAAVIKGEFGDIAPHAPPEPSDEQRKEVVRQAVLEQYRREPPTELSERVTALEIIIGLRDPNTSREVA